MQFGFGLSFCFLMSKDDILVRKDIFDRLEVIYLKVDQKYIKKN